MLFFQLNCIWSPVWERKAPLQQTWLHLRGSKPSIPTTQEGSRATEPLLLYEETNRWMEHGLRLLCQHKALQRFKLKDGDYTPSTSPMSECVSDTSTIQQHSAEKCSWFQVQPSKACRASWKRRVDARWVSDFCQSCIFATQKWRLSLRQQHHSFRNNTNNRTHSLRARKKTGFTQFFNSGDVSLDRKPLSWQEAYGFPLTTTGVFHCL